MLSQDDGLLEPIVLDDGYEVGTVGSQTSTPFSLTSNQVPFELTPIASLTMARQSPSVPFILWPDDDDSEGRVITTKKCYFVDLIIMVLSTFAQ